MTPVREALELARKRIEYLGSFGASRHQDANQKEFFPIIDAAIASLSAAPGEPCALRHFLKANKIMVVCAECSDNYPEGCGHFSFDMLRETPDGRWICESCWDDAGDEPRWRDLPRITTPQPAAGWDEAAKLPCDVHLPPATYINAGCDVSTLLTAIKLRETWPEEDRKFRREAPAPAEGVSADRVLSELSDRRMLNDIDDSLYQEIAEALIKAVRG